MQWRWLSQGVAHAILPHRCPQWMTLTQITISLCPPSPHGRGPTSGAERRRPYYANLASKGHPGKDAGGVGNMP